MAFGLDRLGIAADTGRYGAFCSLAVKACKTVGEHLQVPTIGQAETTPLAQA